VLVLSIVEIMASNGKSLEVEVRWHFHRSARSRKTKYLVIPDSGAFDMVLGAESLQEYGFLRTVEKSWPFAVQWGNRGLVVS